MQQVHMIITCCRNPAFNVVASGEYNNHCPYKWFKNATDTMRCPVVTTLLNGQQ